MSGASAAARPNSIATCMRSKRIRYIGVTFRTRSIEEIRAIVTGVKHDLWPVICDGTLHLPIDRSFALADAGAALEHMRANRHFGKILLHP